MKQIVPTGPHALALRSAPLVARGLRDLARDSNWLIKKVFSGYAFDLAISAAGQVCALASSARSGPPRVVLHDIERCVPTLALSVPDERDCDEVRPACAFAWSPSGAQIVIARAEWLPGLHFFDLSSKVLVGTFGSFDVPPTALAWSATGRFFAAASCGDPRGALRLWMATGGALPFAGEPIAQIRVPESIERQTYEAEFGEEGSFNGYGFTQFSPDESSIASVVTIKGDWADDSILVADAPAMKNSLTHETQGHVTRLSWAAGKKQIVYCAAGQAYRLDLDSMNCESLPFGAELCSCHPELPLCFCFSSWLKNSARGRLFIANLDSMTILDERPAEGISDVCWSHDGAQTYAVTRDGMGYIYDPPLL